MNAIISITEQQLDSHIRWFGENSQKGAKL